MFLDLEMLILAAAASLTAECSRGQGCGQVVPHHCSYWFDACQEVRLVVFLWLAPLVSQTPLNSMLKHPSSQLVSDS